MVWYITRVSWVIEVRHRDGGGEMGEDRAGIPGKGRDSICQGDFTFLAWDELAKTKYTVSMFFLDSTVF